jgi:hypothetical protein
MLNKGHISVGAHSSGSLYFCGWVKWLIYRGILLTLYISQDSEIKITRSCGLDDHLGALMWKKTF